MDEASITTPEQSAVPARSARWIYPNLARFVGSAILTICIFCVITLIFLWSRRVYTAPNVSLRVTAGMSLGQANEQSITEKNSDLRIPLYININEAPTHGASGEVVIIGGTATAQDVAIEKAKFQFGPCSTSAHNTYIQRRDSHDQNNDGMSFIPFPPGCITNTEAVLVIKGDTIDRGNRNVIIGFKDLRNLTPGNQPTMKLTIVDDDAPLNAGVLPTLQFAENPLTLAEGIKEGSSYAIIVKLSHLSSYPISFKLKRKSGAAPAADFFWTQDVKVPAKQSSGYASIIPTNDTVCKPNREVVLTFDAVEKAVISETAAEQDLRVIITDDDCK